MSKFNLTIILFVVLIVSCINNTLEQKESRNDYALVNTIIKKTKEQNLDKTIIFKLNNNNEYVVNILEELKKYQLRKNHFKLDSLKQVLGITKRNLIIEKLKKDDYNQTENRDSVLDSIFNNEQYKYLISQKHKSKWDTNLVDKSIFKDTNNKLTQTLRIAKPIYTSDNKFALVYIDKGTWIGISIYKKENNNWVEHRLIANKFTQPKVEKFAY